MKKVFAIVALSITLFSCNYIGDIFQGGDSQNVNPIEVLEKNKQYKLPYSVLKTVNNNVEVRNGGFGSAATAHPIAKNEFYALTDRGPNTKVKGGKKFPVASYIPRIGHFRVTSKGKIELVKEILLKDPAGNTITGLPNPEGKGSTGETPYDLDGNVLPYDDYGIDSEGLVAMKDGSFWISDEYGPHIVHYSAEGVELERISPVGVNEGNGGRKLPAVFKSRRANRGMEGLAITPNQKMLVGIMQSTMYNPKKIKSDLTRIVTFDLQTGNTKQYLYKQEKKNLSNSEIVALSNTEFLVVERDGKFAGAGAAQKHIYKINIANATDVSGDDFNSAKGMLLNGKTLEESSWEEIYEANIKPVKKSFMIDLVQLTGYPHDKLEGIWLINNRTIGVLNDDDFVVTDADGDSNVDQKILPGSTDKDASSLYLVDIR